MSTFTTAVQAPADEHVCLSGRPPRAEFLGWVKSQTLEGQAASDGDLAGLWRSANERVEALTASEAGIADNAPMQALPAHLEPLAAKVLTDDMVKRAFAITRTEVRMVELDSVVVYQRQINLQYASELERILAEISTDEALFEFCLPLDRRYDPSTRLGPIGPNAWAVLSPSTDLRVLDTVVLDPSQVNGLAVTGAPTQIVAAVVGYGSNFVSAMRVGNRLVLNNGSHRAYALRAAGYKEAPLLVQHLENEADMEILPADVQQRRDLYLEHPRPPILRDYFDDELRLRVRVPRTVRQVRVGINFEQSYAPGA